MPPQGRTFDTLLGAGDPGAMLTFGRNQSKSVSSSVPDSTSASQQFGLKIMELLKQQQRMGTRPFAEQGFNAQQEQINRISAQTPNSLIGANPGLQASVRNASAGALNPTIQGAQADTRTFGEQLKGFGDVLTQTRGLIKDYEETQNKVRDDAAAKIKDAFTLFGGDAFKGADPAELAQLEKIAGYPKGYLQGVSNTLKERELAMKKEQKAQNDLLTTYQQTQVFQNIANNYNKSPLIQAFDRTPVLKDSISAIKKDPSNGALQLNLVYAYIQALDTYQSAVREGELSLVNSIDSKVGQIQGWIQSIQNGQIVRPEVATQIASAAEQILSTIQNAAARKQKDFKSQADVAGVGDRWSKYTAGLSPFTEATENPEIDELRKAGYSDAQIQQILNAK